MFDDHMPPAGNTGAPPPNLPMGEPEDMFSPTEGPDMSPGTALGAGRLQPKVTPETSSAQPSDIQSTERPPQRTFSDPQQQPPNSMQQMTVDTGSNKSKMVGIVITLIVLFLIGVGWVAYSKFFAGTTVPGDAPAEPALPESTDTVPTPLAPVEDPAVPAPSADDSLIFGQPVDQDGDGLDDVREESLSTDPKNWDSDADELSDGDEVIIWKTNPLNPDSDGDTFKDGAEVRAGYSPTGAGRLFEPPTTTQKP